MLVLKRQRNESIRINGDISVTVCEIGKDCVRLGIDAPPEVRILRGELLAKNAIQAAAADSPWTDADCLPAIPCDAIPGSAEKISELARRAENGESLWSDDDSHRRIYSSEDVAAWLDENEVRDGRVCGDEGEAAD